MQPRVVEVEGVALVEPAVHPRREHGAIDARPLHRLVVLSWLAGGVCCVASSAEDAEGQPAAEGQPVAAAAVASAAAGGAAAGGAMEAKGATEAKGMTEARSDARCGEGGGAAATPRKDESGAQAP